MSARLLTGLWLASPIAARAAEEIRHGDMALRITGAATIGTAIRAHGRDPSLVPAGNGALVGIRGTAPGGRNQDDGNLNFPPGKPVSSVVKGVVGIDASYGNFGALIRGKAWYDYTLSTAGMPFGNVPNGYVAGRSLSDSGAANLARFGGMSLLDAYLYGRQTFGAVAAEGRLGYQIMPWGSPTAIPGGLFTTINALDFNALNRPGVLPEEVVVRMPAAYAKFDVTPAFGLEAFYQFANTHNQGAACGTLAATTDYVPSGCNLIVIGGLAMNDPTSLATGAILNRSPTPSADNPQFGFGATYISQEIGAKFGLYYAHVNSRMASVGGIASRRPAAPVIIGDPGGLNPRYVVSYAPHIDMFAANVATRWGATSLYGEATYRVNAPVQWNPVDLLNAFATPFAAPAPPGQPFYGYDRYDTGQYQVGVAHVLADVLGARTLTLGAEAALKQIYGLPSVNVRRYGRSDVYGQAPVNGVCPPPAQPLQCSTNGFFTSDAWGYRLRAAFLYENAGFAGLALAPSVGLVHDVRGWSADGVLNQGRMVVNLALRAEYRAFFADVAWAPVVRKAPYDNLWDRQVVSLSAGMRF